MLEAYPPYTDCQDESWRVDFSDSLRSCLLCPRDLHTRPVLRPADADAYAAPRTLPFLHVIRADSVLGPHHLDYYPRLDLYCPTHSNSSQVGQQLLQFYGYCFCQI